MSKYTDILLEIYEAEMYGDITKEERDFLITEMKTKEEYSRRKFKEKYHYVPSKNDPNKGTITVDGVKHNVDIGNSKNITWRSGVVAGRATTCDLSTGDIVIGKNEGFWKLKNQKRRNAVLQHEIGHGRLHRTNPDNLEGVDIDLMSKGTVQAIVGSIAKDVLIDFGYDKNTIKNGMDAIMNSDDMKELTKQFADKLPATESNKAKLRENALKIFKKYEKGLHASPHEYEADRYAASKSSENDIRRGVREAYKHAKKKIPESERKSFNKVCSEDYKQRSKALKDPEIRSKYKDIY